MENYTSLRDSKPCHCSPDEWCKNDTCNKYESEENLLFHLQESVKWTKPRSKKNLLDERVGK